MVHVGNRGSHPSRPPLAQAAEHANDRPRAPVDQQVAQRIAVIGCIGKAKGIVRLNRLEAEWGGP